jgi:hypothetical protein
MRKGGGVGEGSGDFRCHFKVIEREGYRLKREIKRGRYMVCRGEECLSL